MTYLFREPIDVFDRHLYEKGACVLHSLRNEIGDDAFWLGTKNYLERHAYGSVHTRDLQQVFEDVTGRNLDGFMQQWIYSAGFPDLTLDLAEKNGLLTIKVTQGQKGDSVPEAFAFHLDLVLHGLDQSIRLPVSERVATFAVPVSKRPDFVTVDPGFSFLSRMQINAPAGWLVAARRG